MIAEAVFFAGLVIAALAILSAIRLRNSRKLFETMRAPQDPPAPARAVPESERWESFRD